MKAKVRAFVKVRVTAAVRAGVKAKVKATSESQLHPLSETFIFQRLTNAP